MTSATQHFDLPFPGPWPVLGFWRGPPPGWSCRRSAAHSRCPRRSPTERGWGGLSSGRRGSSSAGASAVTLCSWPALLPPPPAPAAAVWGRDRWMVRSAARGSQTIWEKAFEPPAENRCCHVHIIRLRRLSEQNYHWVSEAETDINI